MFLSNESKSDHLIMRCSSRQVELLQISSKITRTVVTWSLVLRHPLIYLILSRTRGIKKITYNS